MGILVEHFKVVDLKGLVKIIEDGDLWWKEPMAESSEEEEEVMQALLTKGMEVVCFGAVSHLTPFINLDGG